MPSTQRDVEKQKTVFGTGVTKMAKMTTSFDEEKKKQE